MRDSSHLDYERLKTVNFTIVATEKEAPSGSPRQSRASVTVHLRDRNDNSPEFSKDRYVVEIPEDASPGTTVAWVRAVDRDSGLLGSEGIRYTRISGPMASRLHLEPTSGECFPFFPRLSGRRSPLFLSIVGCQCSLA